MIMESIKAKDIKIAVIFIIFFAMMIFLLTKVFGIMFIDSKDYQKEAYFQKTSEKILDANRGDIFDRNGECFSVSLTLSTIFLDPRLIKEVYGEYEQENEIGHFFNFLVKELKIEKEYLIDQLDRDTHYAVIAKEVTSEISDNIILYRDEVSFKGLFKEKYVKRFYPNYSLASHLVGFINSEEDGILGLEKYYNMSLNGVSGMIITEVDGMQRQIPFSKSMEIEPIDGDQIYMTIDRAIQLMTQTALDGAVKEHDVLNGGCMIVMDPETGKILSLASYPEFDLNGPYSNSDQFSRDISKLTTEDIEYIQRSVWRNKAISDTYEPGSTFKVITAAAALEEKIVTPDEIIDAGPIMIDGWEIKHWLENPPAYESFQNAMYNSTNPVFVRVAQELGIQRFYDYVNKFGFNDITGITLPAEANSILKENPVELDMAVNSFGQRFQITPIQLITAYCAIANGGYLIKPYIVDKIIDDNGKITFEAQKNVIRQVISNETSDILKGLLEGTVTYGTGKNAYIKGYRIAGKTGTSETLQSDEGRYIASFAGFAPADSPQIAVLVIFDFPSKENHGGGYVAAPVAGKLIENILSYLRVERNYTQFDHEIMAKETIISNYIDMSMKEAESKLKEENIDYQIIGASIGEVEKQVPVYGKIVSENPIVVLYAEKKENKIVEMPDLIGLTKDEAVDRLKSKNLNILYEGFGNVTFQEYKEGELLEPGTIIRVELKEDEYANGD